MRRQNEFKALTLCGHELVSPMDRQTQCCVDPWSEQLLGVTRQFHLVDAPAASFLHGRFDGKVASAVQQRDC